MKHVLVKWGSIILASFLILIFYLQVQEDSEERDLSTSIVVDKKSENHFLIQDSLITDLDSLKRIVYLGYKKNKNDTLRWDDIIKIYHIRDNDTILKNDFTFWRQEYEGHMELKSKFLIPDPDETIDENSFIVETAISLKGNFSENIFTFNGLMNKYEFVKRVNYVYFTKNDTLGVKTVYFIENKIDIDSTEMNSIFRSEDDISDGIYPAKSKWIVSEK